MSTKLVEIGSLKKNGFILIDGIACRISDIKHSKTGKHGHAKIRVSALGVLDGRRREMIKPSDAKVEVPIVQKSDAQVISMDNDVAKVMDLNTYETFDIKIPEEFEDKVEKDSQILYWDVKGTKIIKQIKG